MIGKILNDKYEIAALIGQGGMAKVYKAVDNRLHRSVAIKILKDEFMDNEQFLKKFLREAQADAKLAHPNIVNVYDVGADEGMYYIVMEYIDGDTLKKYIREKRRITPQETVDMVISIASGLLHAHNNNIIHRDIKPHNILLTSSKVPKVADFGIARAITSSTLTATEEALGSVHYISPEQARGGFLDERSDLYSLGVMMYEMLTGDLPYDGDTPVSVALKHVQNDIMPPKLAVKSIPEGLNQVVLNLTRRKPDDRYQNAQRLIDDLKVLSADINASVEPTYSSSKSYQSYFESGKKVPAKAGKEPQKPAPRISSDTTTLVAVVLVIAAVIVLALLFSTFFAKKVEVPSIVGMTEEEAALELKKAGLEYEAEHRSDPDIENGRIILQIPEYGEMMKKNSKIKIIISSGPGIKAIDDTVGKFEAEAKSMLEKSGFIVKEVIYEYNDEYPSGQVFAQNPAGGIEVKEGTEVTLYVSKGKDTVTMPKLTGMSVTDAKKAITDNGLIVGDITYAISDTFAKNTVMSQSPNAYGEVEKNTRVDFVVSLGPEQTVIMSFNLSDYTLPGEEQVHVVIKMYDIDEGNEKIVFDQDCNRTGTINVTFKGVGTKTYKIFIEGVEKFYGVISFG